MKKTLSLFVFAALMSANAFATYIVVMKDGTRYNAKQKWTVVNGKALIVLESGQSLQVDPAFIDVPKSEQLTKMGITSAGILDLSTNLPANTNTAPKTPSLGSSIKLRTPAQRKAAAQQEQRAELSPSPAGGGAAMSPAVLDKFERAYEEMRIYERKINATGAHNLRAELTVDTEDRVFNAISATALLMVKNAFVDGAQIEGVELFMKTTTGGAAGRFQMNRLEAEAIVNHTLSQQDYFIRHVIY